MGLQQSPRISVLRPKLPFFVSLSAAIPAIFAQGAVASSLRELPLASDANDDKAEAAVLFFLTIAGDLLNSCLRRDNKTCCVQCQSHKIHHKHCAQNLTKLSQLLIWETTSHIKLSNFATAGSRNVFAIGWTKGAKIISRPTLHFNISPDLTHPFVPEMQQFKPMFVTIKSRRWSQQSSS